jgi:hypothetical protein
VKYVFIEKSCGIVLKLADARNRGILRAIASVRIYDIMGVGGIFVSVYEVYVRNDDRGVFEKKIF